MVEGAVRILEVVVHEANVGVIRGAEERGNECVVVILIHRLLLCFAARHPEEYEESE